jgi:hypothetical protein
VLELPAPTTDSGRRPALDAEELRLEQRLDNGRAVDRDERFLAPPDQVMDLSRDELLPCPTFSLVKTLVEVFGSSWTCRRIIWVPAGDEELTMPGFIGSDRARFAGRTLATGNDLNRPQAAAGAAYPTRRSNDCCRQD